MNLSSLDLNLLLVLHTVLEERSVTRAAARLHVTSPAVSNALARLRAALGDPLLVRRGRGLTPTPRAVALAPCLRGAFAGLELALGEASAFDAATSTRRFVLACADSDQVGAVPLVARAFARKLPKAQLQVVSIDQLTATDGLASGSVDVAFAPAGALEDEICGQPLYRDHAVLLLRRDHPVRAARLSKNQFNELGHVDVHLVLGRAGIVNRMAVDLFRRHGLERRVMVIVPTFSAAALVAASTDLAAGMPHKVAAHFARRMPVRLVRLPTPPMGFEMQLIWHQRTDRDPGATYFRRLIADVVRGPGAPPGA